MATNGGSRIPRVSGSGKAREFADFDGDSIAAKVQNVVQATKSSTCVGGSGVALLLLLLCFATSTQPSPL